MKKVCVNGRTSFYKYVIYSCVLVILTGSGETLTHALYRLDLVLSCLGHLYAIKILSETGFVIETIKERNTWNVYKV